MNTKHKKEAIREVKIMSKLNNPYIVKYHDSFIDQNNLNIVMEYCEGGDLANYFRSQFGRPMNENKV